MSDFITRHYVPENDLHALSQVLTEIESVDQDGEDTSEKYLLASLEWPNYRPSQAVWVAELDGQIIGYAVALEQPSQRCTLYVVVHPSHRRQGLGTRLLELTLKRAREVGSKQTLIYANERNEGSNSFLKHHQFQQVGSSGALKAPEDISIPAFEFPAGFTLKKYSEVNEPRVLWRDLNECYQGMWGHQHNDHPSEDELRSPRFLKYYDAEDILLLFDRNDSVIGICSLKSEGKTDANGTSDLLDGPGIIPPYRDLGYQRQLVLAGIQRLRQKGIRPITLEFWGDSETALNIYRKLGFEMSQHYVAYHKELE